MTSPRTLLARLAGALDSAGTPWMITGSTASVLAGCEGTLDLDYLRREAEMAGVGELLSTILPAAPKS